MHDGNNLKCCYRGEGGVLEIPNGLRACNEREAIIFRERFVENFSLPIFQTTETMRAERILPCNYFVIVCALMFFIAY